MKAGRTEDLRIFLAYASLVVRPGAKPPTHPRPQPPLPAPPESWGPDDQSRFIEEVRRTLDGQQADKRDIRGRAQTVLSTGLVLGGAIVASVAAARPTLTWLSWVLYLLAASACLLAVAAAGGVLTGRSDIGAVQLHNLIAAPGGETSAALSEEYAAAALTGQGTVAIMVTALRTTVTWLIISAALFAFAYLNSHRSADTAQTRPTMHRAQGATLMVDDIGGQGMDAGIRGRAGWASAGAGGGVVRGQHLAGAARSE